LIIKRGLIDEEFILRIIRKEKKNKGYTD